MVKHCKVCHSTDIEQEQIEYISYAIRRRIVMDALSIVCNDCGAQYDTGRGNDYYIPEYNDRDFMSDYLRTITEAFG